MDDTLKGLYGQRPSKCADEARRAEFAEIARMTPLERIYLALRLGRLTRIFRRTARPAAS